MPLFRLLASSAILFAATSLGYSQNAGGGASLGPYLVHSVPGGPSVSKQLPQSMKLQKQWTEWAYINTQEPTQTAVIAGLGDPTMPNFRALSLDHGVPTLSLGTAATTLHATSPITASWHLIAATSDGKTTRLYVDAAEVASASFSTPNVAAQVAFSPDATSADNTAFSGRIAFYVADHALTPDEIRNADTHRPNLDVALFEENAKPWAFQTKQRNGEVGPQPPDEMPHGAPAQSPVVKPLPAPSATLHSIDSSTWELAANWKLFVNDANSGLDGKQLSSATFDDNSWLAAVVPGTVLTTLIDRGIYPDPDFGLNNLAIPESLNKHDDWYRVSFPSPVLRSGKAITLRFGGVSFAAEFYLNGTRLGEVHSTFERADFNITKLLRARNTLAVRILPPPHPGIPQEQSLKGGPGYNGGAMVLDGPGFMSTEGWDWLPAIRDRDMGIWQSVTLTETGDVTLGDPQIITHLPLPDTSSADIEIHLPVHNASAHTASVHAIVDFEGSHITLSKTVPPGDSTIDLPTSHLAHPRLWWPNGYGKPDLYHAKIKLLDAANSVSDHRELTFGVREVTVELSLFDHNGNLRRVEVNPTVARDLKLNAVDVHHEAMREAKTLWAASLNPAAENSAAVTPVTNEPGMTDLVIKVNGVRIATRGGNWGLDDSRKRISRERMEPNFRLERDANLNIIRNWQGQNTEEIFYQLADEYGLMVWNDFWMSTENANSEPTDPALLLAAARDTVRRYRTHPSIVLWCGRNEGVPQPTINEGLISVLQQDDGTRYYSPSSNRVNLRPSGPYQWKNPGDYFSTIDRGFSVELGISSFPTLEAFEAMSAPADRWPISDVWAYHDWHQSHGGDTHILMQEMSTQFGAADSLESFERRAQMFNYVDHQAIFEGFYQHLWSPNSGRMLWMTHPAWPSTYWQIYSSDYDTQASYFATKKANAPLHVQMDLSNAELAVVNTTLDARPNLHLHAIITDVQGKVLDEENQTVTAPANTVTPLTTLPLQSLYEKSPLLLVRLDLLDVANNELADNFYWVAKQDSDYRALTELASAQLNVSSTASSTVTEQTLHIHVHNTGSVPALEIKFVLKDATGARILPAYWTDNYVSLLPGEQRDLSVTFPASSAKPVLSMRGWNLATQPIQP